MRWKNGMVADAGEYLWELNVASYDQGGHAQMGMNYFLATYAGLRNENVVI
jgi:hypothetical protein